MNKLAARVSVVIMAAAGLTAGCAIPSQPDPGLDTYSNQELIQTRAVDTSYPGLKRLISSDLLIGYISVVNPRLGQKGDFTRAQVTVQNLTENRYELEYQYQWEDISGFAVGTPRPWQRFVLGPMQARNIAESALQKEAKQALFTVRLVDDTFIELNKQLSN
jgi:uncharacterized protein YcfL